MPTTEQTAKDEAARAMLAALKEIKRTIEATDVERYSDSLRAREATHRLAREAISQAEAAGIKGEADMAKDNSSAAAAAPVAPVQAGVGPWQWMGDSLITMNGLFVIHATATAECGRVNECGAATAVVHFTCTHRRLIAAAPDLLEALTELMAMLRKEAPGTMLNNHRFVALGIKCNNAIAKAGA